MLIGSKLSPEEEAELIQHLPSSKTVFGLCCLHINELVQYAAFTHVIVKYRHKFAWIEYLFISAEVHLGGNGGLTIGKLLLEPTSNLVRLDIQLCGLGDIGAQYIAKALKRNKSLRWLNVSYNVIKDTNAAKIVEALRDENKTLRYLDLSGNDCGSFVKAECYYTLGHNTTLRELYLLSGNQQWATSPDAASMDNSYREAAASNRYLFNIYPTSPIIEKRLRANRKRGAAMCFLLLLRRKPELNPSHDMRQLIQSYF